MKSLSDSLPCLPDTAPLHAEHPSGYSEQLTASMDTVTGEENQMALKPC